MKKRLVVGGGEDEILVVMVNTAESGNQIASIGFAAADTAGLEEVGVEADVHNWVIGQRLGVNYNLTHLQFGMETG